MEKLVIHQPSNHTSKTFRDYNIFFEKFIEFLSKKHDVVVDRYRKGAHTGFNKVDLELIDGDNSEILLLECELIIENLTKNEIYIFSVSDDLTSAILNLQSEEKVKKIFVSQFIREKIYHHVADEFRYKYFPWIYFPSNNFDLELYGKMRTLITDKINKMYFRGSTSYRPILNFFESDVFEGGDSIGGFDDYVIDFIKYDLALSIAGRGEFCYRDIECMAIGIPLIRFEYLSEMYEPLIPNFHYISVDRPEDLKSWSVLDREGKKIHADLITKRFLEIKDDKSFLKFISSNAKKYFDKYLSENGRIFLTNNLLNF